MRFFIFLASSPLGHDSTAVETKPRKDRFGVEIKKGQKKKPKVTFKDQVLSKSLVTVHVVESYKKYNSMDPDEDTTGCSCRIL